jgi:hypothetical protein
MSLDPSLRVIIDGDASRAYREGDRVKGRVSLVLQDSEDVKGLRVSFYGTCLTRTTPPLYAAGSDFDSWKCKRDYQERINLFSFERNLIPNCRLATGKYSWDFEFSFPKKTEGQFSRWTRGPKYCREPHPLPPTFQVHTDKPGGKAIISYHVKAKLVREGSRDTLNDSHILRYLPGANDIPRGPHIRSQILYAQTWKPGKRGSKKTVDKLKNKVSRKSLEIVTGPWIVPTIYYPEKIAPGQHIPLLICLATATVGEPPECILDSLAVTLSTYTTLTCGQLLKQPEDTISKHVTCISKQNINQRLSFSSPTPLTINFRVVDDVECVPSFRTYTITRNYTMTVVVQIKVEGQIFTIESTTPLEILPRTSLPELRVSGPGEDEEVEPLPLYMPREPSKEFAPDYDAICALSPTSSTSFSHYSSGSGSWSVASGTSTPWTAPGTPELEIEQPVLR